LFAAVFGFESKRVFCREGGRPGLYRVADRIAAIHGRGGKNFLLTLDFKDGDGDGGKASIANYDVQY